MGAKKGQKGQLVEGKEGVKKGQLVSEKNGCQ